MHLTVARLPSDRRGGGVWERKDHCWVWPAGCGLLVAACCEPVEWMRRMRMRRSGDLLRCTQRIEFASTGTCTLLEAQQSEYLRVYRMEGILV